MTDDDSETDWMPRNLPVVGRALAFGPGDPLYDVLLIAGPLVVLILALAGRNVVTVALAAGYVVGFVAVLAYHVSPADDRDGGPDR